MQPKSPSDYKQLLTDVIKKQIVILGPDITLSKARNVKGLTVADDGTVTALEGSPQEIMQALIDQFVQLSGLIVKKTMEPLLLATQGAVQTAQLATPSVEPSIQPVPTPNQVPMQPAPTVPTTAPTSPTPPMDTPQPQMTTMPPQPPQMSQPTSPQPITEPLPQSVGAQPGNQPTQPSVENPMTSSVQPEPQSTQPMAAFQTTPQPAPEITPPSEATSTPHDMAATTQQPTMGTPEVKPAENPLAA